MMMVYRTTRSMSSSSSSSSNKLIKLLLSSPQKVAAALDWRKRSGGSILNLTVTRSRLDLAIASHPVLEEEPPLLVHLPSIPLVMETKKRILKEHEQKQCKEQLDHEPENSHTIKALRPCVVHELSSIIKAHSVCGALVRWPVQREGWWGAPCGRVLFTLDQINSAIAHHDERDQEEEENQSRADTSSEDDACLPVCLWDDEHFQEPEDSWGRAAIYAHTTTQEEHVASVEQYGDRNEAAAAVWDDFCRFHWPKLYQHQRQPKREQKRGEKSMPPAAILGAGGGGVWKPRSRPSSQQASLLSR